MKTIALLLCLNCSCLYAAGETAAENIGYVAEFKYAPAVPEKAAASPEKPAAAGKKPAAAELNFAVADAGYKGNKPALKEAKPWFLYPQFAGLKDSLRRDFTAIIAAKGFGVLGPFDSYDLIPYKDKKKIDLYLTPAVELRINTPEEIRSYGDIKVEVDGNIALEMREPMTRELMWVKKVPFAKFDVPHNLLAVAWKENLPKEIRLDSTTPKAVNWLWLDLDALFDGIARGLEQQYPKLMGTIDGLIDPEEMGELKKQCLEVRDKKGN